MLAHWWLRDVVGSTNFANVNNNGNANANGASNALGVRPDFVPLPMIGIPEQGFKKGKIVHPKGKC